MRPAQDAKRLLDETKLVVVSSDKIIHTRVGEIVDQLDRGDVLVINRSATLPSSFRGYVERSNEDIEIRLAAYQGPDSVNPSLDAHDLRNWVAFSFGAGDWRIPTESRGDAPLLKPGDQIAIGRDLSAKILEVTHERLLKISFVSSDLKSALYSHGRPIQYSYLNSRLEVWDQQTLFAGPPISVEPPSASFPFSWKTIFRLQEKGIEVVPLLHGAGISSSGSASLDCLLPLREWYSVYCETADKVNRAKRSGKRVVALGTTPLRALESATQNGVVIASSGLTSLKITGEYKLQVVTSLITGMHEHGTSHSKILPAFAEANVLNRAYREAKEFGYRGHEYGDLSLLDRDLFR